MTLVGDAGPVAAATTILYLVAAWRCWAAARWAGASHAGRHGWRILAVMLLLFGVNKQLDGQTALIEALRGAARASGWYGQRRLLQAIALASIALVLAVGLAIAAVAWRRRASLPGPWVLAGLLLLALFFAARASRILHGPAFAQIPSTLLHMVVEPVALTLLAIGAERAIRAARPSSPSAPGGDSR